MACVLVQGIDKGQGDQIIAAPEGESVSGGTGDCEGDCAGDRASQLRMEEHEMKTATAGTRVLLCSVNTSMFEDKLTSDIHAEANA